MQRILAGLALAAAFVGIDGPTPGVAQQETTVLQGRVLDAMTGEVLIGAQVSVIGSDRGAVTDVDGRYRIFLVPGSYDLRVVYLGYTDKTVTGVTVHPETANYQDITLASQAIEAEGIEVVVSAAEERGSVTGAHAHQRKATNVVNGISAEEISRTPASDAADAIKRVASTSIVGGKYVFVRGLGERYSTAQLDGAALPTPEPEKRVLPLDIFPAGMVESLFTVKSYTADLPGDFAGGLVGLDGHRLAMHHRRAYPDRGGRVRRRSSRRPAVTLLAGLALGAVAAPGLGGCGGPERAGDSASSVERVEAPPPNRMAARSLGRDARPYGIEGRPPEKLRLTGAAKSMEDLLLTLQVALAEHDTTRLFQLMISEREYRDILYPALPAAHPPINAGFETLWVTHYHDAYRGLRQVLDAYGGRDVRILAVRFEKPDQDFVNFVLHETSRVDAEIDGVREDDLRLFGSVIRVGDQWKILSYPGD